MVNPLSHGLFPTIKHTQSTLRSFYSRWPIAKKWSRSPGPCTAHCSARTGWTQSFTLLYIVWYVRSIKVFPLPHRTSWMESLHKLDTNTGSLLIRSFNIFIKSTFFPSIKQMNMEANGWIRTACFHCHNLSEGYCSEYIWIVSDSCAKCLYLGFLNLLDNDVLFLIAHIEHLEEMFRKRLRYKKKHHRSSYNKWSALVRAQRGNLKHAWNNRRPQTTQKRLPYIARHYLNGCYVTAE